MKYLKTYNENNNLIDFQNLQILINDKEDNTNLLTYFLNKNMINKEDWKWTMLSGEMNRTKLFYFINYFNTKTGYLDIQWAGFYSTYMKNGKVLKNENNPYVNVSKGIEIIDLKIQGTKLGLF